MQLTNIAIGVIVLAFGFVIGNYLARWTKEELEIGRRWFRVIIIISLIGGVVGLVLGNDVLLFSFFFVAVVTSRSLRKI